MPVAKKNEGISVEVYQGENELTVDEAKALIGWESEADSEKKFGDKFLFRDYHGNKVRLTKNKTNRPFSLGLAKRYASEILRNKWALNGETIVFDCKQQAQSGQHRLVGFVLAAQQFEAEPAAWKSYGKRASITLPCVIVHGISDAQHVVDTLDQAKKRNLSDVIYRNQEFSGKLSEGQQKQLAGTLAVALRLAWLRIGGKTVSDAPHFPHSEALEFQHRHKRLIDAVNFIVGLNSTEDEENRISRYVTLGYASALFYLQATSATDTEAFRTTGSKAISYDRWEEAEAFWTEFASGVSRGAGDLFHALRTRLSSLSSGSGKERDEICGTIVKAWELYLEGSQEVKPKDLTLRKKKNDRGKFTLSENPRVGGLDVDLVPNDPEPVAEEEAPEPELAETT